MNTGLRHNVIRYMTSIFLTLVCFEAAAAVGNNELKYTLEAPLRIVCETEMYPFEYRNDEGAPDGFNINVAKRILETLHIPYHITMSIRTEANKTFATNSADLIIMAPHNKIPGVYYSKTVISPYKVMIAYTKGKQPIKSLKELKHNDIVILKEGNYCSEYVTMKKMLDPDQMVYRTVKQGLLGIATGNCQYMVCNGATMRIVMKKFGISNVDFADIDIPDGAIRFCSRDKMLINMIDGQLEKMSRSGELSRLYQQAITENSKKDNSYFIYIIFAVFGVLVMLVTFIIVSRYVTRHIKMSMQSTIETNNIMEKALESININVVETNIKKRWVKSLYGHDIPIGGISVEETVKRIHPDDVEIATAAFHKMMNKETDGAEYSYRYNIGTPQNPVWRLFYTNALPEYDKRGNVTNQITTITDITEEARQEKENQEMSEIYKYIFNMPILGLALYDKSGKCIETNQRIKDIFKTKVDIHKADLFVKTSIFDFLAYAGIIDYTGEDYLHFCTFSQNPNGNFPSFIEVRLRPIKDDNGDVAYHIITVQDKSGERNIYRQSKQNDEQVRIVSDKMMQYENELRYLLKVSQMKVWRSNAKEKTIRLFRDLHTFDAKYDFDKFLDKAEEDQRDEVMKLINPVGNHGKAYNATLLVRDDKTGEKIWYAMNSIPKYDKDGNFIGGFGLIRNINDLMNAQIKMKKEKERANDSSRLKSTFLANMSHEIRTPLNAIVGFCDIIQSMESPEEKAEILKIIHNNCNNLLQIISDILVLSELDSTGLTLNPVRCDFAEEFNLTCKSLSQRVSDTPLEFIIDNPYDSLVTTLDKGRISQVITNFLTNAVKHTQKGHIKLGYRKEGEGLYIYCEDTGSGIPEDKREKIFDRFIKLNDYIQGAGIGLSICKAIATKCGGKIGVDSEEGKGSTFWIWIPCDIIN